MARTQEAELLEVRPMEVRDAEAVCELSLQLGYERTAAEIREWIEGLEVRRRVQAGFVACRGEEVVGWIEVSVERRVQSPVFALIGGLVVREGLRGGGIGRRLCEAAEQWSQEQGVSKVRVTSRSSRVDAHRFYERDGYQVTKTSLVLEKKLGG